MNGWQIRDASMLTVANSHFYAVLRQSIEDNALFFFESRSERWFHFHHDKTACGRKTEKVWPTSLGNEPSILDNVLIKIAFGCIGGHSWFAGHRINTLDGLLHCNRSCYCGRPC